MRSIREFSRVWIGMAVVAVLLTGCGTGDKSEDVTAAAKSPGKKAVDASKVRADMVAAVSASKAGPPVTLKFAVLQRPLVGEPVDVEVALIPITKLERLFVKFQPSSGLTLLKGAESPHFESPATGEPIKHVLTVVANNDGIFYISAAVVADAEDSSLTRTFSIPVIAGNGVTVPAPKPTAAR